VFCLLTVVVFVCFNTPISKCMPAQYLYLSTSESFTEIHDFSPVPTNAGNPLPAGYTSFPAFLWLWKISGKSVKSDTLPRFPAFPLRFSQGELARKSGAETAGWWQ
jgi:hypothetical protein